MLGKEMSQKVLSSLLSDHILLVNTGAVSFTLTNVETMLKIVVLSLSAVYTAIKIYQMCKKRKQENEANK